MKEIILPLENHNKFDFWASTCPEGVKFFFDNNHYLLIKNLFSPTEKFSMIEKKVSNAIMKSVYCSFVGDLKMIYSTTDPIKVLIDSGYFALNVGDAFLYDKNKINIKVQKKMFSAPKFETISFCF